MLGSGYEELDDRVEVGGGRADEGVGEWTTQGWFVAVGEDVPADVDDRHVRGRELVAKFDELLGEAYSPAAGVEEVEVGVVQVPSRWMTSMRSWCRVRSAGRHRCLPSWAITARWTVGSPWAAGWLVADVFVQTGPVGCRPYDRRPLR
jgi:hypothetical protein